MELRNYNFSLGGTLGNQVISRASLNFDLTQGFPSLNVSLTDIDQIADLVDRGAAKTLIGEVFTFEINLPDIKKIVNLQKLIMSRVTPGEDIKGYTATGYLMPQAAAFLSAYPSVFTRTTYKWTVKGLVEEIVKDYNSNYPNFKVNRVIFESQVDPIALVAPRFPNIPYWGMIQQVVKKHGLVAILDFDSNIRIFSPITKTPTKLRLSKHNVGNSNLTIDILQSLGG